MRRPCRECSRVADPLAPYADTIDAAAKEWGHDPNMLRALILQESAGNPGAVSSKGARGLTGIMPDTATGLGITDPADTKQQIFGAAKYLAEGRDKEGTHEGALLYYHGGPDWRNKYGPESAGYVPAVAAHYTALSKGAAAPGSTVPSDDDFLKQTAPPTPAAVPTDDDFLKSTGAASGAPKAGAYAGENTDPPDLTPDPRALAAIPKSVADLRGLLAPTPGWTAGGILPIRVKNDANGLADPALGIRPDLGPLRGAGNALLDLLEGTGQATSVGGPNAPLAGRVSPEATNLLAGVAMGGGLTPSVARGTGAAIADAAAAPLSAEFKANPLAPPLAARLAAPDAGTAMAVRPPGAVAPVAAVAPKTAAEAKAIASAYYDKADQAGGTLTPEFANKFVDAAKKVAPQSEAGLAVAGETPVTALAKRIDALRDQPISLKAAQEIDESLGGLIDKEYGMKGLSKDGKNLLDLQSTFRSMIQDAEPGDVAGGKEGFAAIADGRKAWAQAMKMDDLERIQQRAMGTDNPATGIKSGIRTLLANRSRSRGYSEDEIAALKDAQERGVLGGALHVFGSRLIPQAAAVGGFFGSGPIGGAIAGVTSHYAASGMRAGATRLQNNRLAHAMEILGKGVPPNPLAGP